MEWSSRFRNLGKHKLKVQNYAVNNLELGVAAVAEGRVGGVLATAEVHGLGLAGVVFYGLETASRVAAVAEGLAGALTAGAPVIAFAGFNLDGKVMLRPNSLQYLLQLNQAPKQILAELDRREAANEVHWIAADYERAQRDAAVFDRLISPWR